MRHKPYGWGDGGGGDQRAGGWAARATQGAKR